MIFKHLRYILLPALLMGYLFTQGQNYPINLGYYGGQSVLHSNAAPGDTFSISYGGGMLAPTQWKQHVNNGTATVPTTTPLGNQAWLSGFRYNTLYIEKAFNTALFVSKGYYGDYVELRWDLVRYTNSITGFKVYRRLYLSGDEFEQVANLAKDARSWQDEYSESNVLYEYKLYASGISPIDEEDLTYQLGVGFRTPTGRVTGRVTYEGGSAVQGVTIIAETDDDFTGSSLSLDGTSDYLTITPEQDDSKFEFETAFSVQGWFLPNAAITAGAKTLFEKSGQYKLTYTKAAPNHTLDFTANTTTLSLTIPAKADTFFHVAAVRTSDSLKLFALYGSDTVYTAGKPMAQTTTKNNNIITIGKSTTGQYFHGLVDEVRIWKKALTPDDITNDALRYIAGTELDLVGYYRMNEEMGTRIYDLSRKGFSFNENHGDIGTATWSQTVPMVSQLAVKGITDANGTYTISGIPYTTDGSIYNITPVYGIHEFDPSQQSLYIGPGSNTYSNINFTDVASFPLIGYVYYRDTDFPVKGVNVKIDGELVVGAGGSPVATNSLGRFEFDVPIGQHNIQFSKTGHYFSNGEFDRDFQEPYTMQYDIIDTTLVKVIGKVVGGPIEAGKPKGLSKTTNNLGPSKIVLSNANYNYSSTGYTLNHKHPYYTDTLLVYPNDGGGPPTDLQTKVIVPATNKKTVEIYPDTTTGEYVAYLLPELYTINSVKSGYDGATYQYDLGEYPDLDLKNSYYTYTEIDSVIHPTTPFIISNNDTIPFYQVDSVQYHKNLDFIYRVTPSVAVTKKNGETAFWDQSVTVDDTDIDLVEANGTLKTKYPIFTQRKQYDLKVTVFEQYENQQNGTIQQVPVTDGKVEIINNLSNNPATQLFQIDTTGTVYYSFVGGKPNVNGEFDLSMSVVAVTGNSGNIRTNWIPTINWFGGARTEVFKGTVLGSIPKGNNFVSKGPDKVDMIIRDPYGSDSYAFYEVGNSVTTTTSTSISNDLTESANLTMSFGAKVVTWQGVGAGVIQESEVIADATVGMEATTNWASDETYSETVTNTKVWQTSSDPAFVGANGDVFIGRSMNIVYGTADRLEFRTQASASGLDDIATVNIVPYETMRFSPEFATAFQYSQNHIENYLLRDLRDLRDSIILGCCDSLKPYYTFAITDPDDPNFGKKNTTSTTYYYENGVDITAQKPSDPTSGTYTADVAAFIARVTTMTIDGDRYDISLDFANSAASNYWADRNRQFPDRVSEYAESIAGWEAVLARNEQEKLEAELEENLSFDAGTVYSSSITIEKSKEVTETFEFSVAPTIAAKFGGEVMGIGMETELSATYTHTETDSEGTEETSSVTFGFELADGDEGDYYSMDLKQPKTNTGPVFAVKGGQSMCPYVDKEETKFYQVGTQLSAATEAREVPKISCDNPVQINVPGDQKAFFSIELANNSQSADDAWFMLAIDESTNQNGATVKMDGTPIGNGRVIFVPYTGFGQTGITKLITIEQTNQAVVDYPGIKLLLHSICQYDPGDGWEDIVDEIEISAHFIPVCTSIQIDDPDDLWTRNIGTTAQMDVSITGYDLNRADFDKILFQYKPTSSSTWSTAMQFFNVDHTNTRYNDAITAGQAAQQIAGGTLNYTFDLTDQPDRKYDLRAKTECTTGPTNYSSTLTGIKDMKPPKVFGTPQPGDGILSPGEDILIRFDEDIEAGLLISRNFSVRGVLNGSPLRHSAALFFDGVDDYVTTSAGVDYSSSSFAIEFWTKRDNTGDASVIYQQGGVEIGYDAADHLYVKLATTTSTTVKQYNFTDKWIHYTVSYDAELEKLNLYTAYDGYDGIDLTDVDVASNFNAEGRMYVGSNNTNTSPYRGFIHDFRVWEKEIGQGTSAANMSVNLNGDEIGLSGFWPMNELKGSLANDLSRAHHLIMYGPSWQVFPAGKAYNFDGATALNFPTGQSVVVSNSMDFTVEFYFKADTTAKGTVLFSNGKTDGTNSFAEEDIWEIGVDSEGKLYAKNNGTTIEQTTGDFLDSQWHHFALVMRRKSNTTLYLDGEQKGYKHSSFFGGLKGPNMTLGASRHYTNGTPYSGYFKGKLDELRIWNLARTKDLINLDISSKLQGDEMGLVAYYPFDAYDINLLLVDTLADFDYTSTGDTLTGFEMTVVGTGDFESADVPNIQTPRPVQTLNYDWLVNGDELIIRILEQPSLVEKRVIEFTVQGIEDLNRNEMASPETWTAYIKQNTVVWDETELEFEIAQYQGLEFDVDILNIGGVEQDYTISNIPQWLSTSSESGTLVPDSRRSISFEVNPGVNIGTHEEVIYLTTDFGYNERLRIKVKVTGDEPEWEVEPSDFQYSMNVISSIAVDNVVSTDADDKIVAVVNGEIRGIAQLQYFAQYDSYLAFIDVYSNQAGGEEVEFYVWDASEGKVHTKVNPGLTFADNTLHGTPTTPQAFNATNIFYEPIALKNGWNWISFPLNSDDHGNVNDLLSDLSAADGDVFRSIGAYDQYTSVSGIGWVGGITAAGGVNNADGYKLKITGVDTIHYVGAKVSPDTIEMPLKVGWNWIGFVSQKNLAIADAFTNYTVDHGDLLKGQLSFAIYDSTLGWVGNMTYLKPKHGYMYKSAKVDTLIYPDASLFVYKKQEVTADMEAMYQTYGLDPYAFQYNMNAIVEADFCEGMNTAKTVVATQGQQVVGVASLESDMGFTTIYSNDPYTTINFSIIDDQNRWFNVEEPLTFQADQLVGTPGEPYTLVSNASIDDCLGSGQDEVVTQVNEFEFDGSVYVQNSLLKDEIAIHYQFDQPTHLKVAMYDAAGRWIADLVDQQELQGRSRIKWNAITKGLYLAPGVYILQINHGDQVDTEKVINPIK